jgi:hypothetical protein
VAVKNSDDRRGAERHPLPKPVPATLGGFAAKLLDVSLIGCRIEHADRVTPKAKLPLRFSWRGAPVRVEATVVRSEMTSLGGKPGYISGLEFCDSIDASPPVIREIVGWLAAAAAKKMQPAPTQPKTPPPERIEPVSVPAATRVVEQVPFLRIGDDEEAEVLSAQYVQCTFAGGKWTKLYVDEPAQPREGFTIPAPSDESEVDVLCRAYAKADAKKRQAMRASFELSIKRRS